MTSGHFFNDPRIFHKECRTLAQQGFEVHFIAPDGPEKIESGVHIHGIPGGSIRIKRMFVTTYRVYRKAKEIDAHIYHFHDPDLILAGLLLKKAGKKVIYDVHEDVPRQILSKQWIPKPLRKFVSRLFETLEKAVSKKFDGIIAATPFIAQRFERYGCNTEVICNFPEVDELILDESIPFPQENSVIYIGGYSRVRGLFHMIEAIGMTDYRLYLAGYFLEKSDIDAVKSMSGWKKTVELGFLNRDQIRQYFARSRAGLVVLHPIVNYLEAYPVKMFEYMSAGLPIIASNFPLWREIVEGNQCGICVNPLNSEEIKQAIEWIMEHPEEAEKMGQNGRRAVEEKYNWEKEGQKLMAFYNRL